MKAVSPITQTAVFEINEEKLSVTLEKDVPFIFHSGVIRGGKSNE